MVKFFINLNLPYLKLKGVLLSNSVLIFCILIFFNELLKLVTKPNYHSFIFVFLHIFL